MKEATGEANMTVVTIMIIAAVVAFVVLALPGIINSVTGGLQCGTGKHVEVVDGKTKCVDNQ